MTDRDVDEVLEEERLLNQAWIWHLPINRIEAAVVGAVVSWFIPLLAWLTWFTAWPWWLSIIIAVAAAPWLLIAVAMATRSWFTGVNWVTAAGAAIPLLVWAAIATTAHLIDLPDWVHRLVVPATYFAAAVATVKIWLRWTVHTAEIRRAARWHREIT